MEQNVAWNSAILAREGDVAIEEAGMEGEGMAEVVGVVTMIAVEIEIDLEAVVAVGVADLHRTQVDQQEGVLRMRGDPEGVVGAVAGPLMTEGGRHLMTERGVLQQKKGALAEEGQTVERTGKL